MVTVTIETNPRNGERYVAITQHSEGYSAEDDQVIFPERDQLEQLVSDLIDALRELDKPVVEYAYA